MTVVVCFYILFFFFFQAEDGIRYLVRSRGLGDVYKRQVENSFLTKRNIITPSGFSYNLNTYWFDNLIFLSFGFDDAVLSGQFTSVEIFNILYLCLLYTSPSPRDRTRSRMPSSA